MSNRKIYYKAEYQRFRMNIIRERRLMNGHVICQYCGKEITDDKDITAHHIEEITDENEDDMNITMNPENIMLVHRHCHNAIHDRWNGSKFKRVYLVYGAPCSGKSTYVSKVAGINDLIIDMDNIFQMISNNKRYVKPKSLATPAFMVRDTLMDAVRMRAGRWDNAYIIGGYPYKRDRERIIQEYGAVPVYISATKDECLLHSKNAEWNDYIINWFEVAEI